MLSLSPLQRDVFIRDTSRVRWSLSGSLPTENCPNQGPLKTALSLEYHDRAGCPRGTAHGPGTRTRRKRDTTHRPGRGGCLRFGKLSTHSGDTRAHCGQACSWGQKRTLTPTARGTQKRSGQHHPQKPKAEASQASAQEPGQENRQAGGQWQSPGSGWRHRSVSVPNWKGQRGLGRHHVASLASLSLPNRVGVGRQGARGIEDAEPGTSRASHRARSDPCTEHCPARRVPAGLSRPAVRD